MTHPEQHTAIQSALEALVEEGFDGSARSVRRFVASLYPAAEPEPVVRFETAPGHQAQMDWGEYRLGGQRVYAFVGVLGYSRWFYVATSFFHPFVTRCEMDGRIPDLGELNAAARLWCADVANVRVHGTTKVRPSERLLADQRAMTPYVAPQTPATSRVRWPRHPLQRFPKCYDAILQEAR